MPLETMITVTWADTGGSFEIGPTSREILPLPADGAEFAVLIYAEGYVPHFQRFQVLLEADEAYEYPIILRPIDIAG